MKKILVVATIFGTVGFYVGEWIGYKDGEKFFLSDQMRLYPEELDTTTTPIIWDSTMCSGTQLINP